MTHALSDVVGCRLRRVVVRTLDGEVRDLAELRDPLLYIGGEVRLGFEVRSVFVSWVARDGWKDHHSIGVRADSFFLADASLRDWDVSELEPWSLCVGRPLRAARVFTFEDTPHVVELSFERQTWWMADGHEHTMGDGTDLLVRAGAFPVSEGARLAWSLEAGL